VICYACMSKMLLDQKLASSQRQWMGWIMNVTHVEMRNSYKILNRAPGSGGGPSGTMALGARKILKWLFRSRVKVRGWSICVWTAISDGLLWNCLTTTKCYQHLKSKKYWNLLHGVSREKPKLIQKCRFLKTIKNRNGSATMQHNLGKTRTDDDDDDDDYYDDDDDDE
jgi:hypothetical protein